MYAHHDIYDFTAVEWKVQYSRYIDKIHAFRLFPVADNYL